VVAGAERWWWEKVEGKKFGGESERGKMKRPNREIYRMVGVGWASALLRGGGRKWREKKLGERVKEGK